MVLATHFNNASEESQSPSPKYLPNFGQAGNHNNVFFGENGAATPISGSDLLINDVSHIFENNRTYNGGYSLNGGISSSMNSLNNRSNLNGHEPTYESSYSRGAMPLARSSTENFLNGTIVNSSQNAGIVPLPVPSESKLSNDVKSSSKQNLAPKNPKLYKTELCRSWIDQGRCNYGDRCQYAHGDNDKRPIPRHPKYKTEACQSYHKTGYCPYGPRCHFIHNEDPNQLAQMIAENAAAVASLQPSPQLPEALPAQSRPKNLHIPLSASASAPVSAINTPIGNPKNPLSFAQVTPITQQIQQEAITSTPKQSVLYYRRNGDSTGGSPIPSSADSGTESPLGSFSPSFELDESLSRLSPNSFRRSISSNGGTGLAALLNTYSGAGLGKYSGSKILNSALGGLNSSRASQSFSDWSTNTLTKRVHGISLQGNNSSSSLLSSPSDSDSGIGRTSLIRAPTDLPKSATLGAMPTHQWSSNNNNPNRLPVFERLSNGPNM